MGDGAVCIDPVTGIGGIVFTANHPQALQAPWTDADGKLVGGISAWSIMPAEGDPFAPGTTSVMVNDRVADLQALLKPLREEACSVLDKSTHITSPKSPQNCRSLPTPADYSLSHPW
jgi:CBS domain-containing protein